ncbi:MAG TPA: zf-TFIIB domain-containing protein [Chlorobaculum sp.]|nr:zf-TFIIB domain-containing protein [Chlorobaculum sp.]
MNNLTKEYIMKCPECKTDLLISERQGIEIDYCPACRGVWLDRGELDKIIERSAIESRPVNHARDYYKEESHHGHHDDDHDYSIDPKTGRRKRKGGLSGFLGELFD